jgi:hypothetical protein
LRENEVSDDDQMMLHGFGISSFQKQKQPSTLEENRTRAVFASPDIVKKFWD